MTRALLVLRRDADRSKAVQWVTSAPAGTRIEFKAPRRTLDQNSLLWARLTEIAHQVDWYGQKLSAEDWKDVFSASLRKARVVPGIDPGTYVPLGMRTSDMSKEEMGLLLDLIAAFGAEHGVTFRDSEAAAAPKPWADTPIRALPVSTRVKHIANDRTWDRTAEAWVPNTRFLTAGDVDAASDNELLSIENFGKKSLKELREAIQALKEQAS
jgi:NinB protein/Bacterial RNA polymerase, alpha chain C terminal domain